MRHLLLRSLVGLVFVGVQSAAVAGGADLANEPAGGKRLAPVQGAGTGLTASYFNNGTLAGAPVMTRLDAQVDFRWAKAAPAPGLPEDNFSVRWEGLLAAPTTGQYRFVAQTTDEVRLWVNGKKVLDTWDGKKSNILNVATLAAGEKTTIKLEYNDPDGDASIQLQWVPPGQAPQVIPMGNLYPLGSPTTPDPAGTVAAAPAPTTPAAPVAAVPAAAPAPAPRPAKVAKAPKSAAPAAADAPATGAAPEATATAKPAPKPAAAPEVAAAALPAPVAGVYMLKVRSTNKPLDIDQGRPATRAEQLALTAAGRNPAPQWRLEPASDGYYRLLVQGSNKVLEVLGSATSNGAPLSLWSYYSGNNQLWKIEDAGNGYYKLTAKHSRKALTSKDSIDGGFQQWRYANRDNQHWKLEPVAPEQAPVVAAARLVPGVGANQLSVYPNPSNGVVQMAYQLKEEKPLGWVLYNQRGVAVRVSDYRKQAAGPHHQTVDFTGLPAGEYYLNLTVGTENTRQQVSIRRPTAEAVTPAPTEATETAAKP